VCISLSVSVSLDRSLSVPSSYLLRRLYHQPVTLAFLSSPLPSICRRRRCRRRPRATRAQTICIILSISTHYTSHLTNSEPYRFASRPRTITHSPQSVYINSKLKNIFKIKEHSNLSIPVPPLSCIRRRGVRHWHHPFHEQELHAAAHRTRPPLALRSGAHRLVHRSRAGTRAQKEERAD
jgi:hypothetical protein